MSELCTFYRMRKKEERHSTAYAMNEWGFIGQDSFVGIGKSATIFNFKSRHGYV